MRKKNLEYGDSITKFKSFVGDMLSDPVSLFLHAVKSVNFATGTPEEVEEGCTKRAEKARNSVQFRVGYASVKTGIRRNRRAISKLPPLIKWEVIPEVRSQLTQEYQVYAPKKDEVVNQAAIANSQNCDCGFCSTYIPIEHKDECVDFIESPGIPKSKLTSLKMRTNIAWNDGCCKFLSNCNICCAAITDLIYF